MTVFNRIVCLLFFCWTQTALLAQSDTATINRLLQTPLHYSAPKTITPPRIDGLLADPAWETAPWTEYFTDIEGDIRPKPRYHTRVKMLWDESYLYIAAELEEPNIWAYVAHDDEVVFRDNDFEIFVNPDNNARHYFEIEINAIKTIFDLYLPEPYRHGGNALINWDVKGLKKAVHIDGSLNNSKDTDRSWTVEYAIPIASISMGNSPETPHPGSLWRINFSRVEWDTDIRDGKYVHHVDPATQRAMPEHNWVWSPQGIIDMHAPERWGYLQFTEGRSSGNSPSTDTFVLPLPEKMKSKLWEIHYRENYYRRTHDGYAGTTELLGMAPLTEIDGKKLELVMEATAHTYKAILSCPELGETWSIDPEGEIQGWGMQRH